MNDFVLHPEAYSDLDEIWEYIAADNLDAADRVREEIYEKNRSLVTFPRQGHTRADLTSKPLRFQSVRDFVIGYAPEEKPLTVIAVLHGRRNPPRHRCFAKTEGLGSGLNSQSATEYEIGSMRLKEMLG